VARDDERDEPRGHEHERARERVDVPPAEAEIRPAIPGGERDRAERGPEQRELADREREAERHPHREVDLLLPERAVGDHRLAAPPEAASAGRHGRVDVDAEQRPRQRAVGPGEQADREAEADQHGHDERRDHEDRGARPAGDQHAERGRADRRRSGKEEKRSVRVRPEERAERVRDAHCVSVLESMMNEGWRGRGAAGMVEPGVGRWG
jgi:hypothetical protein